MTFPSLIEQLQFSKPYTSFEISWGLELNEGEVRKDRKEDDFFLKLQDARNVDEEQISWKKHQ